MDELLVFELSNSILDHFTLHTDEFFYLVDILRVKQLSSFAWILLKLRG